MPEPSACERLARVADEIGARTTDPDAFLVALGERAAGIRPGRLGLVDLLRGGANPIDGGGFQAAFTDDSGRQARHFAGTARAVTTFGPRMTRWVSQRLRLDRRHSPDGRLGEVAIALATELRAGQLTTVRAGDWIRRHLCDADGPNP